MHRFGTPQANVNHWQAEKFHDWNTNLSGVGA